MQVDCSDGNVTVFSGIKQLNKVQAVYCGQNRPPASLMMPENCATVEFNRKSNHGSFSAAWKKASVDCCRTISIGLSRRSQAYGALRSYLGVYRLVGNMNGAPMYRLQVRMVLSLKNWLPLCDANTIYSIISHITKCLSNYSSKAHFFINGLGVHKQISF